ncbi:MAG TPA: hypothetical protein VF331_07580 [Polyangiales bacterium]
MTRARATSLLLMAACTLWGCTQKLSGAASSSFDAGGPTDLAGAPAALDERYFICNVQPVLTQSCAMFRCHGDGTRYLRIFARNRLRYGGTEAERNTVIRPDELRMNYLAASAMVHPRKPDESFLLRKPLDQKSGGYFHRGATIFGMGNVFLDREDPQYKTLEAWVMGATWQDDPACQLRFAAADGGTDGAP